MSNATAAQKTSKSSPATETETPIMKNAPKKSSKITDASSKMAPITPAPTGDVPSSDRREKKAEKKAADNLPEVLQPDKILTPEEAAKEIVKPVAEWEVEVPPIPFEESEAPTADLPPEGATGEELLAHALKLQQTTTLKLSRSIGDYWCLGKTLQTLKNHPSSHRQWGSVLDRLGINTQSDNRIRKFANNFTFEKAISFSNLKEALAALAGPVKEQQEENGEEAEGEGEIEEKKPANSNIAKSIGMIVNVSGAKSAAIKDALEAQGLTLLSKAPYKGILLWDEVQEYTDRLAIAEAVAGCLTSLSEEIDGLTTSYHYLKTAGV